MDDRLEVGDAIHPVGRNAFRLCKLVHARRLQSNNALVFTLTPPPHVDVTAALLAWFRDGRVPPDVPAWVVMDLLILAHYTLGHKVLATSLQRRLLRLQKRPKKASK